MSLSTPNNRGRVLKRLRSTALSDGHADTDLYGLREENPVRHRPKLCPPREKNSRVKGSLLYLTLLARSIYRVGPVVDYHLRPTPPL